MSAFLLAGLSFLALGTLDEPGASKPPIGSAAPQFALDDLERKTHRRNDWKDARLVVLAFVRPDCPVAELYGATLARLATELRPRRVIFVGLAPGGLDTPADLDRFATIHGISFPILNDPGADVAAAFGVTRTPEVVVLDERRAIRYRGRIDDQYAVGSRRQNATQHDLVDAIQQLLASQPVRRPETKAVGCPVARRTLRSPEPVVTYARDIAPILNRRCAGCHRPGQVGPFALRNYRDAKRWSGPMLDAIDDGRMPPWHADPRFGRFVNDARLSDHEQALITAWVDEGTPEGNPADAPPPVSFPDDWHISTPDIVVAMPAPFSVPAQGVVDYQFYEVDPGFTADVWVQAAEIQPGNRRVVHHCNVFLKAPRGSGDYDMTGELGSMCLDAMTPGSPPLTLPEGMAKRIPAGWHLLFVVHYSPIGIPQTDTTRIGLVLADPTKVRKEVATNILLDVDLHIPPYDPDYRVEHSRRFDDDVLLLSMFPHMHLRGKSFRYEALYPDGREEILLDVPRYDSRWQNRYTLTTPKHLPAGTTLRCTARYDNSPNNPVNPDPSAEVRTGTQTWDEMFNGYYDIVLADQDLSRPQPWYSAALHSIKERYMRFRVLVGMTAAILAGAFFNRVRSAHRAATAETDRKKGFGNHH